MSEALDATRGASPELEPKATDSSLVIWRHCRHYTIAQAALLISGHDPAKAIQVEQSQPEDRPPGYEAAKHALEQALTWDGDFGQARHFDPEQGYTGVTDRIDVQRSIVWASGLKEWCLKRGIATGFFSPAKLKPDQDKPAYLDPTHPRYAPKLAAAVHAWQAVGEAKIPMKMSAKQALMDWLERHAKDLNLLDTLGKPNSTGIEEVAKVANWQTKGGAPKTG